MDSRQDHGLGEPDFLGERPAPAQTRRSRRQRLAWLAACVGAVCIWAALSVVTVGAGQAVLVTHFGSPARVLTRPGLYSTWPAPAGAVRVVDTRLRTTLGALQDITTQDGQHLRVQAFCAWRVPAEAEAVLAFLRAGGSAIAARNIQALLDSAVPVAASGVAYKDVFGTYAGQNGLAMLGDTLRDAIAAQARTAFGVSVLQAGIVRLTLPRSALAAKEAQIRAQLVAEAATRTAQAQIQAAEIREEASRDSKIALAEAQTEAAKIKAASLKAATDIQAKAYNADPDLYLMLRSLDTLSTMVGPTTRLVLRTDAAPFNMLVQGPPAEPVK